MKRFGPINDMKYPRQIVPKMAPMQSIEPTHESSLFVSGPDIRGVASEDKTGNAHPVHAIATPCANMIKLTKLE